jgi:hypothetical protein
MSTNGYLKHRIGVRATQLMLLYGIQHGKLMKREEALRLSAKEAAAAAREQRAKPTAASTVTAATPITESTARQVLIARVFEVAARMRATPTRRNRLGPYQVDAQTIVKPMSEDPIATTPAPVEAAPANELTVVGVFAGKISSSEIIPDEFFHSSMHDRTSMNWKRSLRGRTTWIG